MKKLLTVFFTLLLLAGCSSNKPAEVKVENEQKIAIPEGTDKLLNDILVTPGKLTVTVSTDWAPYEFVDLTKEGQDRYVGSDMTLAHYIADYLGLELDIKPVDFDATFVSLNNDMADCAISGYTWTADQAAGSLYSECYYERDDNNGQVVLISKENAERFTTLESMSDPEVKIYAQNGSTLQQDLVSEQIPNATMLLVDNLNDAYDFITKGTGEGVAVTEEVANTLVQAYPDKYAILDEHFVWESHGLYVLMKTGNTDMAAYINEAIRSMPEKQYLQWVEEAQNLFNNLGDNAVEAIVIEEE